MNEAQSILKQIESVDATTPEGMLDEVDARAWCLKFGYRFQTMLNGGCLYDEGKHGTEAIHRFEPQFRYTRSRDALKSIRPSGRTFSMLACTEGYMCRSEPHVLKTPYLHNEEAAELHAIMQAVGYDQAREEKLTPATA